MPLLTLTTEWGLRDHYTASFKGQLLSSVPGLQIIDVSHDVEKFNTMQGAFIIQNSYQHFPIGTIHFIGVSGNENIRKENPFVIIRTNGHYLIGEDNGIFTLILGKDEKEIRRFPWKAHINRKELLALWTDTIHQLATGKPFEDFGVKDNSLEESYFAQPSTDENSIRGSIIFIDSFGNAVINIKRELFEKEVRGRDFIIQFRKAIYNVSSISQSYGEAENGEMLAIFNQDGFLEIALNKESASKLLGLRFMDPIRIEFHDRSSS